MITQLGSSFTVLFLHHQSANLKMNKRQEKNFFAAELRLWLEHDVKCNTGASLYRLRSQLQLLKIILVRAGPSDDWMISKRFMFKLIRMAAQGSEFLHNHIMGVLPAHRTEYNFWQDSRARNAPSKSPKCTLHGNVFVFKCPPKPICAYSPTLYQRFTVVSYLYLHIHQKPNLQVKHHNSLTISWSSKP